MPCGCFALLTEENPIGETFVLPGTVLFPLPASTGLGMVAGLPVSWPQNVPDTNHARHICCDGSIVVKPYPYQEEGDFLFWAMPVIDGSDLESLGPPVDPI